MGHGTDHHLEHAEHTRHAAHDPFDRNVAMSIAVVAAVLATVTLLSHRAHNQTLQLQIQAGMKRTEAANRWSQYQAKSIRRNQYEAYIQMLSVTARADKEEDARKVASDLADKIKRYDTPADQEKDPAKPQELAGIMALARSMDKEADQMQDESHVAHARGDRYDLAELFVELALVISSVAILTKRKAFWYAGLILCGVGAVIGFSALAGLGIAHH